MDSSAPAVEEDQPAASPRPWHRVWLRVLTLRVDATDIASPGGVHLAPGVLCVWGVAMGRHASSFQTFVDVVNFYPSVCHLNPDPLTPIPTAMSPEHLHVVLNHLPIVGVAAAILPLVVGVVGKRRHESLFVGLLLALVFAGTIPVVMWSGEEAEDRWLHSEAGAAVVDDEGMRWAQEHEERAHLGSKAIYATAGAAGLALIGFKFLPRWRRVAGAVVLVGCILSVTAGVWIAASGGRISHPELRGDAPLVMPHENE